MVAGGLSGTCIGCVVSRQQFGDGKKWNVGLSLVTGDASCWRGASGRCCAAWALGPSGLQCPFND
jgi:hypothetical protein